jgi:uncharacterized protein (TIGR02147 family)
LLRQRNVSNLFAELFSHKEKFNGKESDYFLLLTKLQNTANVSLKKIYLNKVAELMDISVRKTDIKNSIEFLSNPLLSKIQLIISFDDFKATEANLKKILNIDSAKLNKSLKTLEKLNLVESYSLENEKNILYRSKAHYFSVTGSLHEEATKIFHKQTLKEADEILSQDILMKKFKSLFFSLSEDDFIDLKDTLEGFSNKLKVKYGNNHIKRKKLYKINLQAYPVTDTCED